jgi:hypothetical protein
LEKDEKMTEVVVKCIAGNVKAAGWEYRFFRAER